MHSIPVIREVFATLDGAPRLRGPADDTHILYYQDL